MEATKLTCEGCWVAIKADDDVVLASNPVNVPDRDSGELRIFERGEFAYFHARCWSEDDEAGWIERQQGRLIDLVTNHI